MHELHLKHDLDFMDLYHSKGLNRIDALFIELLKTQHSDLANRFFAARSNPSSLDKKSESALLIELAPQLETFIAALFNIDSDIKQMAEKQRQLSPLYQCKKQFVQRLNKQTDDDIIDDKQAAQIADELSAMFAETFTELAFATHVMGWLPDKDNNTKALNKAAAYARWAVQSSTGQKEHRDGVLFKPAKSVNPLDLVPVQHSEINATDTMQGLDETLRLREGFKLTDHGADLNKALDQSNYCIWCHKQGRDSCSTGLKDKKSDQFKNSPFDVPLAGCPLQEKISEMNLLASNGQSLGALAMACVDNPIVAATGHRICNDCIKSCIYQKQEPVNIPHIESRMLKEVLNLPWGFEIYSLLTRWNPLNLRRPLPKAASGYKVLIAGLGPAGFTLAHHLMNEGHGIVAVDGLKIEPLPVEIAGSRKAEQRINFKPIRNISDLNESLDDRIMAGFGGVTEYGITVRWDKNYLKIIRLLLERRDQFAMYGGVRLGSTITFDEAFDMGFDHIALCLGAGAPTVISIPNGMARGVRQASDFLMALQLTGAAKASSIANLQIRLPIVVIGGGLTAIDTATEALAYYPVQVEKFLSRYETLVSESSEKHVRAAWGEEERIIADEYLEHARAIRSEHQKASAEAREPDILKLLNSWGGSTIAYRRRLIDAPSYILNHEEINKAMQEGIRFCELLSPTSIDIDQYGHSKAIILQRTHLNEDGKLETSNESVCLPARSILVAAGTKPNTVLAQEYPDQFNMDGKYFQAVDHNGQPVTPERSAKPEQAQMFTHIRQDNRAISFFGDLHPSFAGNVVKAMASATQGYTSINRMLKKRAPTPALASEIMELLNHELQAHVHAVHRMTPNIVEVIVRAPRAARNFQPGQFYRLQNYEVNARRVDGTVLAMEGVALTGAEVDVEEGLISLILLEMGGSSDLCAHLEPGEPVVLMGPTGCPSEITSNENVLLIGGGLGNAVLFSIGSAFKKSGSKVLYFAGYKHLIDRFKVPEIEAASDQIVWVCDEFPGFEPGREQDITFTGNMLEALEAYGKGELGETEMPLDSIDRIIVIGSAGLMRVISDARHGLLKPYLKPDHIGIGSINSPMQCMMKKICGQCLQPHKDAKTGKENGVVFSCFNQDQLLDEVDFQALMQRLGQQSVQEKLTRQWIDRSLRQLGLRQ
ncbi:FAD-dependent oxidoreductase [Mariprofundus sp. EBB-1]|uniref:FAD-dependent oxidoreductase n=1 Tax=Mariprofundus sp. EBB-1 TaxID=2650971 RepID=UPI001913471A|nr:FAD-dependent oxidoreductase [Mariprofundus sp. EBB-1]